VLTSLRHPSAALEVPAGFDRALVSRVHEDIVLAEVPAVHDPVRLSIPPGEYRVYLWQGRMLFCVPVRVEAGQTRVIQPGELERAVAQLVDAKGDGGETVLDESTAVIAHEEGPSRLFFLGAGGPGAVMGHGARSISLRAELAAAAPTGPTVAFELSAGNEHVSNYQALGGGGISSDRLFGLAAWAGYRWGTELFGVWAWVGLEGGPYLRLRDDGNDVGLALAPGIGASYPITKTMRLTIEGHWGLTLIARTAETLDPAIPSGWVGVAW
jgi:hypothetical protein